MATISKDIMTSVQNEFNAPEFSITCGESASLTAPTGWIVNNPGTGYVSDPASDTPTSILGVLAQDGHNLAAATAQNISVTLATAGQVFEANVLQSGLTNHVLAQADLLSPMGIQRDTVSTPNKIYLNASVISGASTRVFTLRTAQGSNIGDTNARVTFVFLPNFIQSMGTS